MPGLLIGLPIHHRIEDRLREPSKRGFRMVLDYPEGVALTPLARGVVLPMPAEVESQQLAAHDQLVGVDRELFFQLFDANRIIGLI